MCPSGTSVIACRPGPLTSLHATRHAHSQPLHRPSAFVLTSPSPPPLQSQYMFALEHMLILCKENSTKKSYRFKMKAAIPTKDIRIVMDQCRSALLRCHQQLAPCPRFRLSTRPASPRLVSSPHPNCVLPPIGVVAYFPRLALLLRLHLQVTASSLSLLRKEGR